MDWLRDDGLFFLASTSEVYGDPIVHPQPETYHGQVSCTGVRACYDESKRLAETIALDADRRYGTRVKIARYFNVYGPGMRSDDGRAISNFIYRALREEPLPIYGDGSATRSITYVDDAVDATIRLLYDTGLATGPVNIGSDQEIRIEGLAELVLKLCCRETERAHKSYIRYEAPAEDDPKQRKPDLTLARALLRWRANTHYQEGLTITIQEAMKELSRGEKTGE